MTNTKRLIVFLIASFVSAVGDTLMVFAVPVGLGLQTKNLMNAVLMWLIPAVAIFFSSFLHKHVAKTQSSARRNYAIIVLSVAFLEILISCIALRSDFQNHIVIIISLFIFGYAFIKEGVPRLLYVVSVYNYFGDAKDYSKLAGLNSGLNIFAAFIGTLLSALFIAKGSWQIVLLIDALTFVIFGLALMFFGRDPNSEVENGTQEKKESEESLILPKEKVYTWILVSVTLLPIANSMVWNYLPLLGDKFSIATAQLGLFLIAFLRLPGMIAGMNLQKILERFSFEKIIKSIPLLNILACIIFVAIPSVWTFAFIVLIQGLISGVYWPSDYTLRNQLKHSQLVNFNKIALRRLSIFQMLSCTSAIILFYLNADLGKWIPLMILTLSMLSVFSLRIHNIKILSSRMKYLYLATSIILFTSLVNSFANKSLLKEPTTIVLPSVSHDLTLRSDLTFSSFAILNDIAAHFVKVSKDLIVSPDVIKDFQRIENGKRYVLNIDPEYKSSRGETISSYDIEYTLKYYLSRKKDIAGVLNTIAGAETCKLSSCRLSAVKIISENSISIELSRIDLKFVEKLSSPWLLIFKKDRPLFEKIGTCILPYQMGKALVIGCENNLVKMVVDRKLINITSTKPDKSTRNVLSIVNDNPGLPSSPTLTVLSIFANPSATILPDSTRFEILNRIRLKSKNISEVLKLTWSPLMTAKWLGVTAPEDLIASNKESVLHCPVQPIKILLDTSLPDLEKIRNSLRKIIPCELNFNITNADKYFENFSKNDFGIAWFSPDYLDLYNEFSCFDCTPGASCYFNWHDAELQNRIDKLRINSEQGKFDKELAISIERRLLAKGYAAPISEMNWWIRTEDGFKPIHPGGLGQLSISDFL